ncbi:MAG: methylaspartate mutase, partial [Planctomycetota bacterium]
YKLPVIFAGNNKAVDEVKHILGDQAALYVTENIRPTLETENLKPARDKIHDLFLEHVMAQAPGYQKLMGWTSVPLMPTPGAVGLIMQLIAEREGIQVVGVDIGGATTDVFSVFRSDRTDTSSPTVFNRTVSANLGMSYSIFNVVAEAGFENVVRWVPLDVDERDIRNRIRNKMIRPTTIPQTIEELMIEQAISREALRLAFIQHKQMAVGLKGVQQQRTIADAFEQGMSGQTLVDMMGLNMIVGSGGVLSHSPRRCQSAMMMMDGFYPEGFTELTVDSIFMMPQLGVLSTVHEQAALQVFNKDCLIRLGWCVAPVGTGKPGQPCMKVEITAAGQKSTHDLALGDIELVPLELGKQAEITVTPAKGFDIGAGPGQPVTRGITGGVVGLILDARGRPFELPTDRGARVAMLLKWAKALDLYPST